MDGRESPSTDGTSGPRALVDEDHLPGGGGANVFDKEAPTPKRPATYAIIFMLGAQVFSASMNVSIRLLENTATGLHPLQILFVRMSITTLAITAWLWRQNKPHNILGMPENRSLLLLRAVGGFLGVFGLYYSLRYLNLSEATVITFMMPLLSSLAGHFFLHTPLPAIQVLLSMLSFLGVFLVAAPDAIMPSSPPVAGLPTPKDLAAAAAAAVPLAHRIQALAAGLLGVCGSAAAFLSMSALGKAENPMTVVNYFAAMCTLASLAGLVLLPGLGGFRAPADQREWVLLTFSSLSGFLMQFLITMSLQAEKSLVAVNMVYTQIVFALVLDAVVFHAIPHPVSLLGCTMVMGSAVFLAWHKTRAQSKAANVEVGSARQDKVVSA